MEPQKPSFIESQTNEKDANPTLIITSISMFLTSFLTSSLNVAIPYIGREFQANTVLLSWIVSSFLLTLSVFLVPFGRIADIVGLKKIFLWGFAFLTLFSVAAAFSNSIIMLIICRALQGLSCALAFGTGTALTTATNTGNKRGRALGINVSSVYIGYSAGPFLGGLLTEHLGWRSLFLIAAPISAAVVLLVMWKIKGEWAHSRGEKFDTSGSIVYGSALIALIYGLSLLPEVTGIVLSAAGIIGIFIFLIMETRIKSPVVNLNIFRSNRTFLFSNLGTLIGYSSIFAMSYLMSLYLQYIKGFTPDQTGIILLSQPLMLVICAPFTGRLSDKIEPRIVASIGLALMLIGLFFLTFISATAALGLIITILIILGLGMALFVAPNNNAVMSSVVPKYYGIASAMNGTMRALGQTLSISIAAAVIAVVVGRVVITSEHFSAFISAARLSFGFFSFLCLVGIIFSLTRGKIRKTPPNHPLKV